MKHSFWHIILLLGFGLLSAQAQTPWADEAIRDTILETQNAVYKVDTLTIWPSSVRLLHPETGDTLPSFAYQIFNTSIRFDTSYFRLHQLTKVRMRYKVLPFDLQTPTFRLDNSLLVAQNDPSNSDIVPIEFDYSAVRNQNSSPWQSNGLETSGSYTRGIALGNNQNLSFNSNLNLQLGGKLGDDLEIAGALTDNSIPLQPDGTTANIQEFDRIFLQIKKGSTTLTAGDNDLQSQAFGKPTYFTRYFKRLQGAQIERSAPISDFFSKKPDRRRAQDSLYIRTAAAISKGKFNRMTIQAREGNQGPYRLQGAENERFIILLAGTERVWVDGVLLKRGLAEDYVMDYNLAELTFTTRTLMTKDKRIIVEFEYAVQNFLRSTLASDVEWRKISGNRLYFSAYSEQDGLNSGGGLQNLTANHRSVLAQAGDDISRSVASGVDTLEAGFDPERVLYKYVDTLVCGQMIQVLQYTTSPDSGLYAARFSELPFGQGNYERLGSSANGRVYRYVAPDPITCTPKGSFEPVVQLIAPEKRQLFAFGGDWTFFKDKTKITAESSLSNRDLNRFSPLDAGDNVGLASFVSIEQAVYQKEQWKADAEASYEFTQQNFKALNQYRAPEFTRDWNTENNAAPSANHLAAAGLRLQHKKWGEIRHNSSFYQRLGQFDGLKNTTRLRFSQGAWAVLAENNILTSNGLLENTRFSRPKIDLSRGFYSKEKTEYLRLGIYGEREKNSRSSATSDTLNSRSFYYDVGRVYLKMPENSEQKWTLSGMAQIRKDYAPESVDFALTTTAKELSLDGSAALSAGKTKQNIRWNGTFRQLDINRTDLSVLDAQKTWLGRMDYSLFSFNNGLAFTSGYEVGAGQQPKTEFNYVEVNPGDGQYTWIDRNRDSILQIDEMEQSVFQDQARYIRIAVTTNDFVPTRNVNFNGTLRLDPRLFPRKKKEDTADEKQKSNRNKGLSKAFYALSTQSGVQINRKVLALAEGISPWNPFELDVIDTALVNVTATIRNTLFINRANPSWGITLSQSDITSRYLLTTGLEGRNFDEYSAALRLQLARSFTFESESKFAQKVANAQNFPAREYLIEQWATQPKLTWLPGRNFRLIIDYTYQNGQNATGEQEKATVHRGQSEITWNPASKEQANGFQPSTSIRAKVTLAAIAYTGLANTPVAYTMLDGLQNGRNLLWSASVDRQLNRSMQLSISYEGRKTGDFRVIHTGRALVRAVF